MAKKEKKTADVSAKAAETKETKKSNKSTASTADSARKKKYTVEDILAGQGQQVGANGKKKKIKVKMHSKLRSREARWGYFFTFPWIVGAAIFLVYPIGTAIYWSFRDYSNVGWMTKDEPLDNIFDNYTYVLTKNPTLWSDIGTFLLKMVIAVPLIVVFALLMALLLNTDLKGKGAYRTLFFLPVVIVSGPTMSMMMDSSSDIVSAVDMTTFTTLVAEYLPGILATAVSYVFENIIIFLWFSGVQILIFISALQKMDPALYEAAKIDGGSTWECFWKITLPNLQSMILLNAIYTVISLAQDENISTLITTIKNYVLTPSLGGPSVASAFAIMYTIVILLMAGLVALLLMPKADVYEKQIKKNRKMEKRTRRSMKRTERRVAKNEKKFAAQEAKKAAKVADLKAKGKYKEEEKGGRLDG